MRLTHLTYLGFYLNGAQSSGKFSAISIGDVKRELENNSLFEFLESKLGSDIDTSRLHPSEKEFLSKEWKEMSLSIDEARELCISEGGLSLLLAYVLETIQRFNSGHYKGEGI